MPRLVSGSKSHEGAGEEASRAGNVTASLCSIAPAFGGHRRLLPLLSAEREQLSQLHRANIRSVQSDTTAPLFAWRPCIGQ